jgi:putative peptidoglycan lipid II flippase
VSETGQGSADGNGRAVIGAAGLLAGSVLIARALGYLRDALFASEVGVGSGADAYFAAFMIPDILGYLLAAGAAATAVTPPYVKRLQERGPEAAASFASVVVGTVGLLSIAFTVILWFAAEPLLRVQFPDFDVATLDETTRLMRIVLPAQIFFLTGGILRGVLMAHGRFWPQAWAAIIYSATPIVGGLAIGGAEGFAWGTLVGAALGQWAVPVFALRQLPGAVGRMRVGLFDGDFREYVWLALPLMLGLGLTTVDEWYEKWVGGQIEVGAIASITYARKLMMAPVGVVGQAVGAALLPSLTMLYQNGDEAGFRSLFGRTLRTTLGLGILAAGALALLATPLVELLYERRAFTAENTTAVSGLLVVLSIAVPGWVVQQVAVRGFYARGEMWRAMILSTSVALAVIPLYLIGGAREGVRGLAMASATAITLNALITVVWLRRRTGAPKLRPLAETFVRTTLIMLLSGFIASFLISQFTFAADRAWLALLLGGGIYGIVALVSARSLGDAPLRAGIDSILTRLTRRSQRRPEPR